MKKQIAIAILSVIVIGFISCMEPKTDAQENGTDTLSSGGAMMDSTSVSDSLKK